MSSKKKDEVKIDNSTIEAKNSNNIKVYKKPLFNIAWGFVRWQILLTEVLLQ